MNITISEEPGEETSLLLIGSAENLPENVEPEDRRRTSDGWKRNTWVRLMALLVALPVGTNSGYTMATNTTIIGKDMGRMQDGVLMVILPPAFASLVPTLVPILPRNNSPRISLSIGPVSMVAGFFINGLAWGNWRSMEQVAGVQSVIEFGGGLSNLLMYLTIKEVWSSFKGYALWRAVYQAPIYVGMAAGALGGPALIECLEGAGYVRDIPLRPWQFPFLLESSLVVLLLACVYCIPSWMIKSNVADRFTGSDALESFCVALCAICPITLCAFVAKWGIHWPSLVVGAILEAVFASVTWMVRRQRTNQLYSTHLVGSQKVQGLVLVRATISSMVRTILSTLPLYAQIRSMQEPASGPQHSRPVLGLLDHASNGKVGILGVKQNSILQDGSLPVYYAGQLAGEFAAAGLISWLGCVSLPLLISMAAFCLLGLPFGFGYTGSFPGVIKFRLFMTGLANGSSDNSVSAFLFDAANNDNRPGAEALSTLAGNILAAVAPTFAILRYKAILLDGMTREHGEDGSHLANMALENITAVYNSSFSSNQRNDTLRYARGAIEQTFFQVALVLMIGVVVAFFLFVDDKAEANVRASSSRGSEPSVSDQDL